MFFPELHLLLVMVLKLTVFWLFQPYGHFLIDTWQSGGGEMLGCGPANHPFYGKIPKEALSQGTLANTGDSTAPSSLSGPLC